MGSARCTVGSASALAGHGRASGTGRLEGKPLVPDGKPLVSEGNPLVSEGNPLVRVVGVRLFSAPLVSGYLPVVSGY